MMVLVEEPAFPVASYDVTVIMLLPMLSGISAIAQIVVPAAVPDPPIEFAQVTLATVYLSKEIPAIDVYGDEAVNEEDAAGVVIVSVGAVVS